MSAPNFEFQRNLPFTEFSENGSWLQRRDAGAYLVGFILFFASILITQSWWLLAGGVMICLAGIKLSRTSFAIYFHGVAKALPIITILALINLFINPVKDITPVVFHFWMIEVTTQDINLSLLLVSRFVVFMLAISITTASLSVSRFIHGLEDLFAPLKWIGVQIHDLIVSVEIAIRYIPLLLLTAERIAKAQASRGATWGTAKGSILQKARQIVPLIVPLFLQSFQKADKIAMAMDARGYGLISKRSRYHTSRVTWVDVIFVILQMAVLATTILLLLKT